MRMPISGIYKIKGVGDVLAGRVEQGVVKPGEEVVFLPTHTASNPCTGKVFTVEMHHLLTRLHQPLLNTSCKHIPNTLNLVNARDWHPHWGAGWSLRHAAHLVKEIIQDMHLDLLTSILDLNTLPPAHVEFPSRVFWFQEVITHPTRDGKEWHALLNHVFLPANFDQHALHLVGHLLIPGLLVACSVAVHLVAAAHNLLHAQQIDETRMLTSLTLDFTCLVVALGNCSGEISIAWNHDHGDICLG